MEEGVYYTSDVIVKNPDGDGLVYYDGEKFWEYHRHPTWGYCLFREVLGVRYAVKQYKNFGYKNGIMQYGNEPIKTHSKKVLING